MDSRKSLSDSHVVDVRDSRRDSIFEVNFQDANNNVFTRKRSASDPRRKNHSTLTIISGEINTQVDTKLRVGHIGRGYNCLDGSVRTHLFDDLKAIYVEEKSKGERLNYFKNYEEYIREAAIRAGVNDVSPGLFSMCGEPRENFPFLSFVDRIENYQHYLMEIEETFYTLKAKIPSSTHTSLLQDEDVAFITKHDFNEETKRRYFSVLERYGTHFFKSCTFGNKAELRWSFPEKIDKDALERVSSLHTFRNKILDTVDMWKRSHFSSDFGKSEDERVPKNALEIRRTSHSFYLPDHEKPKVADQIRYQLEEISTLFTGPTRTSLELAIKIYLEEMKPKSAVDELRDDGIVGIYSLDYNRWVRVDGHGHLFADGIKLTSDCQFRVKKKGVRVALKTLKYKDKFLSKALITSIFHFHRLQFMGPHESFELAEHYLKACGNISGSSYIYITPEDKELHHNGDLKRKNRFIVIDAEKRINTFGEESTEEPMYPDDDMEEDLEVKVEPIIKPTSQSAKSNRSKDSTNMAKQLFKQQKYPIKEVGKSNSTSSIYIKDTILLPNIDELTRCMATYLHDKILRAKAEKIIGKYVEVFSEEKYPLTKAANSIVVPSIEAINHYVNTIFKVARLSAEAGIMCIIYMGRVLSKTNSPLTPDNWRRISLACLMLASKVWEDQAVWNVDFIELFPTLTVKDLNKLESALLNYLEFSVGIKASEYVKVYFDLREHSAMSVEERLSRPMDEADLKKLEIRTASSEKQYEKEVLRFHKSSSMDVPPDHQARQHHHIGILS